jgi:hypothetical protein
MNKSSGPSLFSPAPPFRGGQGKKGGKTVDETEKQNWKKMKDKKIRMRVT